MISDASDPCGPARYRLATADRIREAVRQVIARCADHLGEPVKHYRAHTCRRFVAMGPQYQFGGRLIRFGDAPSYLKDGDSRIALGTRT